MDEIQAFENQIEKILTSRTFHRASSLKQLLQYLARKTLSGEADSLDEATIGREVFGKAPDYDPQLDPSVRVQIGRLRAKLAEYYTSEGRLDPIIVQIPRGHFTLELLKKDTLEQSREDTRDPGVSSPRLLATRRLWVAIIVLLFLATAALWWLANPRYRQPPTTLQPAEPVSLALRFFWKPVFESQEPPVLCLGMPQFFNVKTGSGPASKAYQEIIIRNAFTNSPDAEVTQYWVDKLQGKATEPFWHYVGAGEALGALTIVELLARSGIPYVIARSHQTAWEILQAKNVIYLGPPKYNPQLNVMKLGSSFRVDPEQVTNLNPRPGEPEAFAVLADQSRVPALVGRYPNESGGVIYLLASCNTFGTLGAVRAVTEPNLADKLLQFLSESGHSMPEFFEVILDVQIDKEYPVQVEPVVYRVISPHGQLSHDSKTAKARRPQ